MFENFERREESEWTSHSRHTCYMCDADTKETSTPPFDKLSNYDRKTVNFLSKLGLFQ